LSEKVLITIFDNKIEGNYLKGIVMGIKFEAIVFHEDSVIENTDFS
jgi:hypothetical protein